MQFYYLSRVVHAKKTASSNNVGQVPWGKVKALARPAGNGNKGGSNFGCYSLLEPPELEASISSTSTFLHNISRVKPDIRGRKLR